MNGLDAVETASRDELQKLQFERLRWSLNHAWNGNGFYRSAFAARGIHPGELDSLGRLADFPFTTKSDLRAAYPFGFLAVPQTDLARIHASSGTTGKPTIVGYTRQDLATWGGLVARSIYAAGGRPGMKVHIAFGYGLFTGGLGAHYGAEALGCGVIPMSGGQTEKQVQLITDLQPDILMSTPSYALALVDEMRKQGVDPAQSSLRIGIFGAEPWTEVMRAELQQSLGLRAADIYGLSELMGPGVGCEYQETQDGPTIWEDHFYPEIIDPDSGSVLPDGEHGELVLTSLTRQAMPVIRYRTRDLTRLLPGTARTMRRLERIASRSDDMMILRGVNVYPTQIEEQVLIAPNLAPHYEIELYRMGRMDAMRLIVEAREHLPEAQYERERAALITRIKQIIGVTVEVEVRRSGAITRSSGKASRIRDLRLKDKN